MIRTGKYFLLFVILIDLFARLVVYAGYGWRLLGSADAVIDEAAEKH